MSLSNVYVATNMHSARAPIVPSVAASGIPYSHYILYYLTHCQCEEK